MLARRECVVHWVREVLAISHQMAVSYLVPLPDLRRCVLL